ncbi:MAG TPA: collagen-binding domain-containing protein [Pedomonas sp.]|nr:collagen-binding domain-containing protein [Pedomonas sp.]
MIKKPIRFLAGAALAGALLQGAAHAGPVSALEAMRTHNVIVFDDFRLEQDIKGSLYVDGHLGGRGNGMVGSGYSGYSGGSGLTVTGDVVGQNIRVKNSDVRVGGNVTGSIEVHDRGSALIGGQNTGSVRLTGNTSGRGVHTNVADAAPALNQADFASLSASLAALTAESLYSASDITDRNNFRIHAADRNNDGIAVVSLGADFFDHLASYVIAADAITSLDTIVVNVAGLDINLEANWLSSSAGSNLFGSQHIIWNFFEAETVNLSRQIFGSVLAPNAIVTNTSSIEGNVVAGGFTQRAQVNLPGYAGTRLASALPASGPVAVSEPAVVGLLGIGALGIAALRRKKRA